MTEGAHISTTPADADFAIAECEGPGDYDGIVAAISAGNIPSCPKAIVTNFNLPLRDQQGVPQPQYSKPLIDAGFQCLTECYMGDNPNASPPRMDFTGRQCGWASTSPVFGVYNATLNSYASYMNSFPGWSAYLAEYIL